MFPVQLVYTFEFRLPVSDFVCAPNSLHHSVTFRIRTITQVFISYKDVINPAVACALGL